MKLKDVSKDIYALARQHIGGWGMRVELGVKCGKINGKDAESVNWAAFDDTEQTDLADWMAREEWQKVEITEPRVELDFYVSGSSGPRAYHELLGNLGVIIENGVLTQWRTTGRKWAPFTPTNRGEQA